MENTLFNVSGRIINNSGDGLKNLIIVFYDTDRKIDFLKNYKKNIFDFLEEKGSERLGSTYSKDDGSFEFTYEYEDFAPQKEEKRPDIVLVILSPEEKGKKLTERILYYSEYIIHNGGRNEALLIQLNNPASASLNNPKENKSPALYSYLKQIKEEKKEFSNKVTPLVIDNVKKKKELLKDSLIDKTFLTTLPKSLIKGELFLKNKSDVQGKMEDIITRANNKYQALEPVSLDKYKFSLSKEDIAKLDIDGDALNDGEIIEIPYSKYCGLLNEKTGGKNLIKKSSIDELIGKILEEPIQDTPKDPPPIIMDINPPEVGTDNSDKFISTQLKNIYGIHQNGLNNGNHHESIKTDIKLFKQLDSAADQKAYHDFHHLQVAFESVWFEAFDGKVKSDISKLYDYAVEVLHEYYDPNLNSNDIKKEISKIEAMLESELTDYRSVLTEIGKVANMVGDSIPVPSDLYLLNIHNVEDLWKKLSFSQQNTIIQMFNNYVSNEQYFNLNDSQKRTYLKEILYSKVEEIGKNIRIEGWEDREGQVLYNFWCPTCNHFDEYKRDFIHQVIKRQEGIDIENLIFKGRFDIDPGGDNHDQDVVIDFTPFVLGDQKSYSEDFKSNVKNILNSPNAKISRVENIIQQLNERLLEPYSFHVFAPDSVNYGILTTYRQEWIPENWQVGDLVSTIPLAPGEKRKFNKKLKVKKTRAQKEVEKSLYSRSDESSYISKAHNEIVQKAQTANNFNMTVNGNFGFSVGVFNGGGSTATTFQNNQSIESTKTKKSIRESTIKASHQYKNERNIEVSTTDETDFEESSSGEISNPNNEITVTYLFYELERQYRISESLHKLTPVIMVAFDVPAPHQVDEDWLLTHEWILRRILLDDSFNEAFDYLREGIVGDQINYEAAKGSYNDQKEIVKEISGNVESLSLLKASLQEQLNKTRERKNIVEFNNRRKSTFDAFTTFTGAITGAWPIIEGIKGETNGYDPEYYKAEMDAYETRLNMTKEELASVVNELERESNTLEKAKNLMMSLTQKVQTKRNLINQLRIHVKQNILYYMQGIWEMEPPDQRFFRLYDKPAKMSISDTVTLKKIPNEPQYIRSGNLWLPFNLLSDLSVAAEMPPPDQVDPGRKLHEVADLDNLLGFKGNFAIFPLKECTYITDYMMRDYVNDFLGLVDPHDMGTHTIRDLRKAHKIALNKGKDELAEKIAELITAKLSDPQVDDELVVVPTGQLFIEALPGKHALLEDFKLKHRAMDVLKVQEEVREAQIENLRKSARVLDDKLDDPDIDKIIKID
ncbi:hypothetical protein [Aquimarina sp. AU119]|uniref:hypothetical protein n=1 Tax=Aquimarina sp. AU119 TaxID=2108528 RepID=UPI000D693FD6|nr:hypothetical protein [Aquimarina sp. AU119]